MLALMKTCARILNSAVASVLLAGAALAQAAPDDGGLNDLFDTLKTAPPELADAIEEQIWEEWSQSGSAAMDVLLERGRDALRDGDVAAAIEHFSALVDWAPDFAEAWNGRATAYFQADLYGPAMFDIREVLRLNPRHFGAMSGLALILEETEHDEEALQVWRKVVLIHPHADGAEDAIRRLAAAVEGTDI